MIEQKTQVSDLRNIMRLIRSENVGPKTFRQLITMYGSPIKALEHLEELARLGGKKSKYIIAGNDLVEKELEDCLNMDVEIISYEDPRYPNAWASIDDMPPVIFVKGQASALNMKAIGIVGARNCSLNGIKLAKNFASAFAKNGIATVSGMARGIDTAAHEASIDYMTIAVLAGGVDHIYPQENKALYEKIAKEGLIISEHPPKTAPLTQHFPQRNRMISGLAAAVLIVEASLKSGSLITARYATKQERAVFAVPGSPLDPRSSGCNALIQNGVAEIALAPESIIEYVNSMQWCFSEPTQITSFAGLRGVELDDIIINQYRTIISSMIGYSEVDIEDILLELGIPFDILNLILLEMELAGKIFRSFGNKVIRIEE